MKVYWDLNPLTSKITLNEVERKLLHRSYLAEQYDMIGSFLRNANKALTEDERQRSLNYADSYLERADAEEESGEFLANLLEYLQEEHLGDCTCVPASCMKCYAEYLLGFSTTSGLGKSGGHAIHSVFHDDKYKPLDITGEQALEKLNNPNFWPMNPSWKDENEYAKYIPRWTEEYQSAGRWYKTYLETKAGKVFEM